MTTDREKFKKEMEASQYFMNKNAKSMFDVIDMCKYYKSEEKAVRQTNNEREEGSFVKLLNQEMEELIKSMKNKEMIEEKPYKILATEEEIKVVDIKDSVMLTKEEFEKYKEFKSFMERNDWKDVKHIENTLDKCQEVLYERLQREYKKGYKKGKEKMKNRIFKKLFAINGRTRADIPYYRVVELAKQFDVEIKD